jgi:ribosomal protein L17
MKNKIHFRKLGRPTAARKALFSTQMIALLTHERIRTTLPKAKELRRIADTVITWAKQGPCIDGPALAVTMEPRSNVVVQELTPTV